MISSEILSSVQTSFESDIAKDTPVRTTVQSGQLLTLSGASPPTGIKDEEVRVNRLCECPSPDMKRICQRVNGHVGNCRYSKEVRL